MYIIVIVFSYNTITKLKNIIVIVQVDTSKKNIDTHKKTGLVF